MTDRKQLFKYPPDADMEIVDLDAEIEGVTGTRIGWAWNDPKTKSWKTSSYFLHFKDVDDSKRLPGVA